MADNELTALEAAMLNQLELQVEYYRLYGPWFDGAIKCDELLALLAAARDLAASQAAHQAALHALEASHREREKLEGVIRYMAFDAMKGAEQYQGWKRDMYLAAMKDGSQPILSAAHDLTEAGR